MNKGRLLIVGASGHGKVAAECAYSQDIWSEILFFDDRWPTLDCCCIWKVIGTGNDLFVKVREGDEVFVAIGDANSRMILLHRIKAANITLATLIHPRSCVSSFAKIGMGSMVAAGAVISIAADLGYGCIVNTGATVDHDSTLAEGVHVCPGAHLAGSVKVGARSWIGIGGIVRQGVTIGADVIVGAGAVVIKDVPDEMTVVGVPARKMEKASINTRI